MVSHSKVGIVPLEPCRFLFRSAISSTLHFDFRSEAVFDFTALF
jgi:hypothetical protein